MVSFDANGVKTADVVIRALKVKCLLVLLCGLSACHLSATDHFVIFGTRANIVDTFSQVVINECRTAVNLPTGRKQKNVISWCVIVHLIILYVKWLHRMQSAK